MIKYKMIKYNYILKFQNFSQLGALWKCERLYMLRFEWTFCEVYVVPGMNTSLRLNANLAEHPADTYAEVHRLKRHRTSRARGNRFDSSSKAPRAGTPQCVRHRRHRVVSWCARIHNTFHTQRTRNVRRWWWRRQLMAQEGRHRNSFRARGPSAKEKNVQCDKSRSTLELANRCDRFATVN